MTLESPTKRVKVEAVTVDDKKRLKALVPLKAETKDDVFTEKEPSIEELRKRFVGDVTLPESKSSMACDILPKFTRICR